VPPPSPSYQIQPGTGGAVRGRAGGPALLFVSVLPGRQSGPHLQHHAGSAGAAAPAARPRQGRHRWRRCTKGNDEYNGFQVEDIPVLLSSTRSNAHKNKVAAFGKQSCCQWQHFSRWVAKDFRDKNSSVSQIQTLSCCSSYKQQEIFNKHRSPRSYFTLLTWRHMLFTQRVMFLM